MSLTKRDQLPARSRSPYPLLRKETIRRLAAKRHGAVSSSTPSQVAGRRLQNREHCVTTANSEGSDEPDWCDCTHVTRLSVDTKYRIFHTFRTEPSAQPLQPTS